jgi:hypothetical protein
MNPLEIVFEMGLDRVWIGFGSGLDWVWIGFGLGLEFLRFFGQVSL